MKKLIEKPEKKVNEKPRKRKTGKPKRRAERPKKKLSNMMTPTKRKHNPLNMPDIPPNAINNSDDPNVPKWNTYFGHLAA